MIDHVSIRVQDFPRLVAFYKAALAPLGYDLLMEFPGAAGLGKDGKPDLWLTQADQPANPTHVALSSERAIVEAFHAAGLAAGGSDNGPPGLREYHPHYYAAFILDPEGNNIEVVCHADPDAKPVVAPRPAARKTVARRPAARKATAKAKKPAKAAARKPAAKGGKVAGKSAAKGGKSAAKKKSKR
jgi:catechol 2,3-dioxygenase-like lactoylglutathione lyase family enzyme